LGIREWVKSNNTLTKTNFLVQEEKMANSKTEPSETKAKLKKVAESPLLRSFMHGAAFTFGGIVTNRIVSSASQRRIQKQIQNSENVVDFKTAANS